MKKINKLSSNMRYAIGEFLKENFEYVFLARRAQAESNERYHEVTITLYNAYDAKRERFTFTELEDTVMITNERQVMIGFYCHSENTRKDAVVL